MRKKLYSSSSESENEINMLTNDDSDDDSNKLLRMVDDESAETREELALERPTLERDDYVLVSFQKKKCPTEYYVGKIISKDVCGFEFKIQFFKRIGLSSKFISESQNVFHVNEEDILVKLPKPTDCSGSAR